MVCSCKSQMDKVKMFQRNWCKNIFLATDDQDIFGFVALMRENLEYQGGFGYGSQPGQSSLGMPIDSSGHRHERLNIMTMNKQPN